MPKPTITMDQARAIIREIGDNYRSGNVGYAPGQYPPYQLDSVKDRSLYHAYVEDVVLSFVLGDATWEQRLEEAFLDASRFIPTDRTVELNADTNRVAAELMDRRKPARKPK